MIALIGDLLEPVVSLRVDIGQIDEVPRTLSGKVLEVPVKRILMGTPADQAASRESLANPSALDYFIELGG